MLLSKAKSFLSVLNKNALVFLGMRSATIMIGILSIILLCRAVTVQYYFLTDGLGRVYDMMPLGPLVYSIVWSVASIILPGCERKYHPALDMALDFLGWMLTCGAGAALLQWSLKDAYEVETCRVGFEEECSKAGSGLSTTEKCGAILLFLSSITHLVMFIRACRAVHTRRKQYIPSRNSFIQLQKDADQSSSVPPLELNYTTLTTADAEVLRSLSESTEKKTSTIDTVEPSV